jgi:mono/diheme cytochrome c family protein
LRGTIAALLTVMVAAVLGGCSDHGDPLGVDNPPEGDDPVSYAADIQPIFDANCIGCHGAGGNGGLDLRSGLSHANLVGVAANTSGGVLVVTGDASNSVFSMRLAGSGVGVMPPSGPLPASVLDLVDEWINDGALNN